MSSISFIIPSINRESLKKTIDSIELWPGDEICVEFDIPPSRRWGNDQRNKAMARANGDYLAFIDDDDEYVGSHRELMGRAIEENQGRPILFRIVYPDGTVIWKEKKVIPGNVSTQMILVPNIKNKLFTWKDGRNMADFIFIDKWPWPKDRIVWRPEIICYMGHNDG